MSNEDKNTADDLPEEIYALVEKVVRKFPEGISEYELLQALRDAGCFSFMGASPALPSDIFRAHFILFHILYQWRDHLLQAEQAYLQIDPLAVKLLPYEKGRDALAHHDRLRDYYLDLNHLEGMTEQEVNELIASFWNRLNKFASRDEALAELGLKDPVNDEEIKMTYRRLAMQHHPDRGGDKLRLQEINAAMTLLLK